MGVFNISIMILQVWLLLKSRSKLKDVKTYYFERPTYNILTVIIIRLLQVVLVMGLLVQVYRGVFYFYGNDFGKEILIGHFGVYYSYEVIMQFLPFMIEYVYLV